MTDDIKLPPLHYDELPEYGDAIPAMHDYARRAIKFDRQQRGEPVKLDRYDAGLLGGQDGMPAYVWHDIIRSELDRAYDFYMDQIDRAAPQPAAPAQVPSDWKDRILTEMERRFRLRGEESQYERLRIDDTQLGVEFAIEHFSALLARYGQTTEPEGWQLVPKEPTQCMFDVFGHLCRDTNAGEPPFYLFERLYLEMLAAAPKFGEDEWLPKQY